MNEPRWCVPGDHSHHKFEDCVTEALYGLTMDSSQDNTTGETDWEAWVAYFSWFGPGHPPYKVDAGWIGIPTGAYLLLTDDRGFVWSRYYATDGEAREDFDRIDTAYGAWLDRQEEGDAC